MQLNAPAQPASHIPSSQDILSFLHSSLLLAGRDILSHGAQGTITTAASTAHHGQLVALTGVVDTRKDNTPLTNAPEFIKNLGEDIDGMWAVVAESASRVPVLGEMVYDIIEGMRHSRYWKNDYYRILRTASVFVALTGLVLGPITGLAAAVFIAFSLVLPVTALLLTGAVFFGIVALPVAFLNGIALVILSGTTWLLAVGAGISMIVFGALLAAGVVDLFAGLSFVFTLPIIPIPLNFTPIVLAALAVVARLLGVALVVFGVIVLMASGLLLVGVFFGLMMILAPWLFIAGLFLLTAAIWLFAFIISLAIIGPIALITIPLATLPWMLAALAVFLFGMFIYAVSGNTNRGPQYEGCQQERQGRQEYQEYKESRWQEGCQHVRTSFFPREEERQERKEGCSCSPPCSGSHVTSRQPSTTERLRPGCLAHGNSRAPRRRCHLHNAEGTPLWSLPRGCPSVWVPL